MPDPTPPEGTRKSPAPPPAPAPGPAPTGTWHPADPGGAQLATPTHIGRFQIQTVLGTGSYGRVFLAFDPEMGRQVAIKQPFGEGLRPEYRADFLKEARAVAAIDQHANICPVYDVDTEDGVPYIVMRFVAGGTLKGLLERRIDPMPIRPAVAIVRKLALGLAAAHARGIIHRDLKPANVLYDEANREVLITDFGLARISSAAAAAGATLSRGAHGTPFYMPPEQWGSTAFGPVTALADVYSLGIIFYELLTGAPPFSGDHYALMTQHCAEAPTPPSMMRAGIDAQLDAICLRALEKQPAARHPSAKALAAVLTDYLRAGPAEPLPLGEPIEEPKAPSPGSLPYAEWIDEQAAPGGQRKPAPAPPAKAPGAPPSASETSRPEATLGQKEVVRCPKCKARLEVLVGRNRPINCPMCSLAFSLEAGRRAAAAGSARPAAGTAAEPLSLDDEEPAPSPKPPPKPEPRRTKPAPRREAEKPRRRSRLRKWVFFLFVLGGLAAAGYICQDDLLGLVEKYQPKPVELTGLKEFTPGADQARVYRIVPAEGGPLVITNSERRDVVALAWNATTGRRVALKVPTEPGVALDPKVLQFRFRDDLHSDSLAVFSRDPASKDRGDLWVYTLPEGEDAEATATPRKLPRRPWDVNNDQTRAVGEPKGTAVELWSVASGLAVATLKTEGAGFRSVGFTPDGKSVVGLDDESHLRFWNAETGEPERSARLAVRPLWDSETGDLSFDADAGRVTVTTGGNVGVWGTRSGEVVSAMKPLTAGAPLNQKYRLRAETAGRGTFSVFHDDHRLRAAKWTVPGGEVSSWSLSDDRTLLAASSGRRVFLWRLKYPAP